MKTVVAVRKVKSRSDPKIRREIGHMHRRIVDDGLDARLKLSVMAFGGGLFSSVTYKVSNDRRQLVGGAALQRVRWAGETFG